MRKLRKPLFAPPPQYPQKDNEPEKKKRRIIWTAIIAAMTVLLAVIAVVVWIRVGQERKYTEQMELGDRYLAEMKYEDAQICFRKAIEINPKQAQPPIFSCPQRWWKHSSMMRLRKSDRGAGGNSGQRDKEGGSHPAETLRGAGTDKDRRREGRRPAEHCHGSTGISLSVREFLHHAVCQGRR